MDYTREIKLAKEGGNKGARNPILYDIPEFHSPARNNSLVVPAEPPAGAGWASGLISNCC